MAEWIISTVVDIICLQFLYIYTFACSSKYQIAIVDEKFSKMLCIQREQYNDVSSM